MRESAACHGQRIMANAASQSDISSFFAQHVPLLKFCQQNNRIAYSAYGAGLFSAKEDNMPTPKQQLGQYGELVVVKLQLPKVRTTKALFRNFSHFKCADIICDFCGYLAQVKAATVRDIEKHPDQVLGAAGSPRNLG